MRLKWRFPIIPRYFQTGDGRLIGLEFRLPFYRDKPPNWWLEDISGMLAPIDYDSTDIIESSINSNESLVPMGRRKLDKVWSTVAFNLEPADKAALENWCDTNGLTVAEVVRSEIAHIIDKGYELPPYKASDRQLPNDKLLT
jgi:hypothetical protein